MFPNSASNDSANRSDAATELNNEFVSTNTRCILGSNVKDVAFCQPMPSVRLALALSILGGFVCHVVGLCSEKQVIGVAASRVVTLVQDKQTIGDRTVYSFPCDAMCTNRLSSTTGIDLTVSIRISESHPQDTAISVWSADESQEAFLNWNCFFGVKSEAFARAKNRQAKFYTIQSAEKVLPAMLADAWNGRLVTSHDVTPYTSCDLVRADGCFSIRSARCILYQITGQIIQPKD